MGPNMEPKWSPIGLPKGGWQALKPYEFLAFGLNTAPRRGARWDPKMDPKYGPKWTRFGGQNGPKFTKIP